MLKKKIIEDDKQGLYMDSYPGPGIIVTLFGIVAILFLVVGFFTLLLNWTPK